MKVTVRCDYEPFLSDARYSDQEKLDKYLRLNFERPRTCPSTLVLDLGGPRRKSWVDADVKAARWRCFGMNCSLCTAHLENLYCTMCGAPASQPCVCQTVLVRGPSL